MNFKRCEVGLELGYERDEYTHLQTPVMSKVQNLIIDNNIMYSNKAKPRHFLLNQKSQLNFSLTLYLRSLQRLPTSQIHTV